MGKAPGLSPIFFYMIGTPELILKKYVSLLMVILVATTLVQAHEESVEGKGAVALFENAATITVPFVANPDVEIDGEIGATEYSDDGLFVDEDTGMQAYLEHDNNSLYVGLKSPGNGWIAMGFGNDARDMEKGANVIMGFMNNGALIIRDDYAPKIDSEMEHDSVGNSGAKSDIISASGTEDSTGTTIEFVIPLHSKDKYGRSLEAGKVYPLIIAFSNSSKRFNPTLDEGEIHFEKIYVARQNDNLKEISDMFSKNISPANAVAAVIILGISFIMLLLSYYPWRTLK